MPRTNHFGFWTEESTDSGQYWPGGNFATLDEWEVGARQVVGDTRSISDFFDIGRIVDTTKGISSEYPTGPWSPVVDLGYSANFELGGAIKNTHVPGNLAKPPNWAPTFDRLGDFWRQTGSYLFSGRYAISKNGISSGVSQTTVDLTDNLSIINTVLKGPSDSKSFNFACNGTFANPAESSVLPRIRGPYLVSKNPVKVNAGQIIEFWWKSQGLVTPGVNLQDPTINQNGFLFDAYIIQPDTNFTYDITKKWKPPAAIAYQQLLSAKPWAGSTNNQGNLINSLGVLEAHDHKEKIQELLRMPGPTFNNKQAAYDIAIARKFKDLGFRRSRTRVTQTGDYHIVFIHGSYSVYHPRTFNAMSEVAAIRIITEE